MNTLLHIDTSLHAGQGHSSRLAREFAGRWQAANPQGRVIHRDLAADPPPHLDADTFAAFAIAPETRSAVQAARVALSDRLITELREADTLVLGLPMYNFGVPSTLKAWFDHVARAGVSFRYTASGPEGLLTGKRAIVFATRGGRYAHSAADHQVPYVRQFLAFLGIDDVEVVYAEGLAMGDNRDRALEDARRAARRIVDAPPKAA